MLEVCIIALFIFIICCAVILSITLYRPERLTNTKPLRDSFSIALCFYGDGPWHKDHLQFFETLRLRRIHFSVYVQTWKEDPNRLEYRQFDVAELKGYTKISRPQRSDAQTELIGQLAVAKLAELNRFRHVIFLESSYPPPEFFISLFQKETDRVFKGDHFIVLRTVYVKKYFSEKLIQSQEHYNE